MHAVGISMREAAAMLGVSHGAFRTLLLGNGSIRTFNVGRRRLVLAADIERWAREQAEQGDHECNLKS